MKFNLKKIVSITMIMCLILTPSYSVNSQETQQSLTSEVSQEETSEIPEDSKNIDLPELTEIPESETNGTEIASQLEDKVEDETVVEESPSEYENIEIELNQIIDNNTLFISGKITANLSVNLTSSDGQVLMTQESQYDGSFIFELPQPFEAGEVVAIQVLGEERLVSETFYTVKSVGLELGAELVAGNETIHGTTSPNRVVNALDELGNVLNSANSDGNGYFNLELDRPLQGNEQLSLQVMDDGRVARSEQILVEEVHDGIEVQAASVLNTQVGVSLVSNEAFGITSVSHTGNSTVIVGYINEEKAVGLLEAILNLLYRVVIDSYYLTFTDNLGNEYGRVDVEGAEFMYTIPQRITPGTELLVTLSGVGRRILIILSIGSERINMEIAKLSLNVPGVRLEEPPRNLAVQKESGYQPNAVITRENSINPTEAASDYSFSVFDNTDNNWTITAQSTGPLSNENNHQLDSTLFFKQGTELTSLEQEAVVVATKNQAIENPSTIYTVSWPPDQGIVIQTNPFYAQPNTTYTTSIQWTVSNVP